jgi:hypothetical protein
MKITLDLNNLDDYRTFLKVKSLPQYRFVGRTAIVPDEYAGMLGLPTDSIPHAGYQPIPGLFDYQRDIAALAIRRRKFAVFADPGLGKTLMFLEFARYISGVLPAGKCVLIVTPLMVVDQMLDEVNRFYGESLIVERVRAAGLSSFLTSGVARIGITNHEALRETTPQGRLGGLIIDESSILKSHYGRTGARLLRLGRGLDWIMAGTGTPAPNDRIEFANHAVLMGAFPTVNSFLAKFFVNRGQTGERWELKPHALRPFYRALSHWCIFLTNPGTYGWRDNTGGFPPVNVHIHDVELSADQTSIARRVNGTLFAHHVGGITTRSTMGQLAKGRHNGHEVETLKPAFIRNLVDGWPGESTLIWCRYDHEQETLERAFPEAASLKGSTSMPRRQKAIADFQAGRVRVLISKAKVLGFGLNLQAARHHVFSTCQDSYEEFRQCIGRSNRYGSIEPLDVHLPVTDLERPMVETVLTKAHRVQHDVEEQERLFQEIGHEFLQSSS